MPSHYARALDTTEPNQKEEKIMNVWRLNPAYHLRKILAGAVVSAWALASPAPALAGGRSPGSYVTQI